MRFCLTLERPAGTGQVYRGEKWVAEVYYTLKVVQEYFSSGKQEVLGLKDTFGQLTVLESDRDLADGRAFKLKLADNREWQFLALAENGKTGIYKVVSAEIGGTIQRPLE